MALTIREFVTRWGFDVDTSELEKMEARTRQVRQGFLKIGAAATATLVGLAAPAAAMDDILRRSAAAAGVSAEEFGGMLDRLRAQGMDVAEDLGLSGQRIADGFFDVISAGVTPAHDQFEAFSNTGFRLAKVMGGDVGPAVERLKTTLNAFQMGVGEAATVSDVFVKANTLGQTSIEQLSEAMGKAGPIAVQAGKDLEETTALLIGLAEGSFRGAEGGEGLKQIMLALGAPTDRAKAKLKDLGITLTDDKGNFLSYINIIAQFETKLKRLSESQRLVAVEQIVGREAAAKFLSLIGQGSKRIEEWDGKLRNSKGATKLYIEQMTGFVDIGRRLIQAVKNMAIVLGTPLLGPLTAIAKVFLEATKSVRAFLVENPRLARGVALVGGGALGIVALGSAFGALVTSITLARIAVQKMGMELLLTQAKAIALPLLLVAIGALLFLIFDDIAAALAGNESTIGNLIDKYSLWGLEIKAGAAALAILVGALAFLFAPITLLIVLFLVLAATIARNWDAYSEFWKLLKSTSFADFIKELKDWIFEWTGLKDILEDVAEAIDKIRKGIAPASAGARKDIRNFNALMLAASRGEAGEITRDMFESDDAFEEFLRTRARRRGGVVPGPSAAALTPPTEAPIVPPGLAPGSAPGRGRRAPVNVRTGDISISGVGRDEIVDTVRDEQERQVRDVEAGLDER